MRVLIVVGIFFVDGERVVRTWAQVVDAEGVSVVEFGELLA